MKNKLLYLIVFWCILGSMMVSSMESPSYTFKSIFYGISMTVLIIIGLSISYKYLRRRKKGSI